MSKREIASLACKVLGIFFIIQGTNVLSNILLYSMATPDPIANERPLNIIFSLFYIFVGVLLWFLSDKMSAIMVTGESNSNKGSGIEAGDIQRVAFSVLGLYFMGNSLPRLVTNLSTLSGSPNSITRIILGSVGGITEFIIGLGIFFGSQGLVNFLNILRTAGLKKENGSEDKE